jgi:uncharacterized protein
MNALNPLLKDGSLPQARAQEPSMEDILASIRRIIAEDHSDGFAGAYPQRLGGVTAEPLGLDQTEGAASSDPEQPLLSSATENSVVTAFNILLASKAVQQSDLVIDLARDMLRPMLKAWLDDNLPAIVERLVKAEIERLTRAD